MRRSKAEMNMHLVWATKGREPFLTPSIERAVQRCIVAEAEKLQCVVRAIGGMPDHVHLIVDVPPRWSVSDLMKRVKGVSSAMVNDLNKHQTLFRWQEGYAVFCVCRSQLPSAVAYVLNQKNHHSSGTIDPYWEETDEEAI